jgi:hypothetical protein
MLKDDPLHLSHGDVLAAALDHLLLATPVGEVTVIVEIADVSRAEPPVRSILLDPQ